MQATTRIAQRQCDDASSPSRRQEQRPADADLGRSPADSRERIDESPDVARIGGAEEAQRQMQRVIQAELGVRLENTPLPVADGLPGLVRQLTRDEESRAARNATFTVSQ